MDQLQGAVSPIEDLQFDCRPTDIRGGFAELQKGTYGVKSSDPTIVADGVVIVDGDKQSDGSFLYSATCETKSQTVGDTCTLTVSGDGDVGDGVITIEVQYQVTVVHANAAQLGLSVTRVPKP